MREILVRGMNNSQEKKALAKSKGWEKNTGRGEVTLLGLQHPEHRPLCKGNKSTTTFTEAEMIRYKVLRHQYKIKPLKTT